jgi:hypothetical protein
MKFKKIFPSLALAVMLSWQAGAVGVALAEDDHPASPTPTPEATASPAPDPSPTPQPTAAQAPAPDPHAGASSTSDQQPPKKYTDIGPDGCGGVVPDWVFNVSTNAWEKADTGSFSCDKASGYYLSPLYTFDKRSGWYEIMPPQPSAPDYLIQLPAVLHTTLGDLAVGSKDYQVAKSLGLLSGPNSILVSGTGPDSNNAAKVSNASAGYIDLTNMVNVINNLQSAAASGNVAAGSNTQVGNAVTGAASVIANLINLLSSAWAWSNGNLTFFMQNILGNQTGDLTLAPSESATGGGGQLGGSAAVSGSGPGSNNVAGLNNSNTLDVNSKSSGNIVNNVNLGAQSGNADATGNTQAGNVASGPASAEVNIINLINSMINSGSSFFGILNIFGNLNGDILFPNGFLNGLVPTAAPAGGSTAGVSATGPGSINQAGVTNSGQATVNNTIANSAFNNLQTSAKSGVASADANTQAGNVSSGLANTTSSLFNLANDSIMGDNAVLVIVNVLGHWIGTIMNLPGGGSTESALLTGNATVTGTGPDSNNRASVNNANNANVNQSSVGSITNNVKVNAQSGDATAERNTRVGNVTSGTASAATSVANIFNSVLNLKHWFGVLVINVFGDWTGDVNHNSAAGTVPVAATGAQPAVAAAVAAVLPATGLNGFATAPAQSSSGIGGTGSSGGNTHVNAGSAGGQVLTAAAESTQSGQGGHAQPLDVGLLFGVSALVLLLAGALATIDQKLRRH